MSTTGPVIAITSIVGAPKDSARQGVPVIWLVG